MQKIKFNSSPNLQKMSPLNLSNVEDWKNQAPYTGDPIQQFLKWYDWQSHEHRVELAEFIGHYCYDSIFSLFKNDAVKIYAFKEYLNGLKSNNANTLRILRFIDEIIEFIVDINEAAENRFFNWEELLDELPDVTSLFSVINELPDRSRKWSFTYLQWQRFKAHYSFFGNDYSLTNRAASRNNQEDLTDSDLFDSLEL